MKINKIYHGNNIEILKTFEDNSIDSIVADPPYGLGKEPDALEVLQSWITTGYHEVKGKGFMGKEWDAFVPQPNFWRECLRVLKPGGHLLSFAGTRTYDWVVMGLRIAGFEIRDQIAWVYGQGFPKSTDIVLQLKKVLKIYDDEVKNEEEISREQKTEYSMRPLWKTYIQETKFITQEQWEVLQSSMQKQSLHSTMLWEKPEKSIKDGKESCMEGWSYIQTSEGKLQWCKVCESTSRIFSDGKKRWLYNGAPFSDGNTFETSFKKNGSNSSYRPQSEQQQFREPYAFFIKRRAQEIRSKIEEFDGFGTSLKPALEPIVMARKPLDGTVAQNVLKYGVGGINIDGCRVELNNEIPPKGSGGAIRHSCTDHNWGFVGNGGNTTNSLGRFPANFIHDGSEEVVALFPETQSGNLNVGHKRGDGTGNSFIGGGGTIQRNYGGDSGSAARFFYTAKASQTERNWGLDGFEEDATTDGRTKPIDNAFNRGETKRKNIHPTVKPIDLMRYLVRLVTPKDGVCLDPFMGSGTTAVACKMEGFNYVGCELMEEYVKIAEARIKGVVVYDSNIDTKVAIQESQKEKKKQELGIMNIFDFLGNEK